MTDLELSGIIAKLNVNPQYQAALRDAESESWDEPGTDVRVMIKVASERRRAARAAVAVVEAVYRPEDD